MEHQRSVRSSYIRYLIGFALSITATFAAYFLATEQVLTSGLLVAALAVLAFGQLIVQLFFFLHLGEEIKPRLRLLAFGFMTSILLIIVVGSVWIMYHLNYNMMEMSPSEKDYYMTTQKDKGF